MTRRFLAALCALALILCLSLTVYAATDLDLNADGSISLTMKNNKGKLIKSGKLTIYRVCDVVEENGNYRYVPTADFSGCGLTFESLNDAGTMAQLLKNFVDEANKITVTIRGTTKSISALTGEVKFTGLDKIDNTSEYLDTTPGLFLIVQTKRSSGYALMKPFLVTIPHDGAYDVIATPKMAPPATTSPTTAATTPDSKLPQTGQLNWPVPVLAAAGLALFTFGVVLRRGDRKEDYES